MPTANFINLCTDKIAKVNYYFYLDNSPLTDVKSISDIRRNNSLSVGEVIVLLDNTAGTYDYLYDDANYLHIEGTVQLGFDNELEVLNLFTGILENVLFLDKDALVQLTFNDKASMFLQTMVGDSETPVEYGHLSDTLVSDVVWDILTNYGNLDPTTTSANVDIDYDWWLAWAVIMLNGGAALDPYYLQFYLTGQSIGSILQKVCDLTESTIWVDGGGKVKFTHRLMATSGQVYTQSNIIDRSLALSTDERVGGFNCYYGYDNTTGEWAGNIPQYSASTWTLGRLRYDPWLIEQDRTIWHRTELSAQRFIDESDERIGYPTRRFNITTGLTGFLDDIGNMPNNQHNIGDITLDDFYIEEMTLTCDQGIARITGCWLYA